MATVTLDWGARSEQLRVRYSALNARKSFLLANAPTPVVVGVVAAAQAAQWDTVTPTPVAVTPVAGTSTATAAIPDTATLVRLDFSLRLTIGSATATCLEFRQLFSVGAGGSLMPSQYSFQNAAFRAGSASAASSPVPVPPTARRTILGASPLVTVTAAKVTVNCEFLDVTELWWANWAAKDQWGWYLDPDLHGRPDLLRVLAWTSGTAPMLWVVALSDQAVTGTVTTVPRPDQPKPRTGADIVFFRAQAGLNSFRYSADEAGFLNATHGDKTMYNIARWMLSPLPEAEMVPKLAKTGAGPPANLTLAGMRVRPNVMPPAVSPADPLDAVQGNVFWAFRPVGVEAALLRSPGPDIAYLPLGFDAGGAADPFTTGGGYTALMRPGELPQILTSARALLWMRGAISSGDTATPTPDRQIWLLANSAANRQMFSCLNANSTAIDRVISCDATPSSELLVPAGVPAIQNAAAARKKAGKAFKAVVVTTPNMWWDAKSPTMAGAKTAYQKVETALVATKADVVMLPPDAEWNAYWTFPPTATSNPNVFEVLRFWDGNGLATAQRFGTIHPPKPAQSFQWLFWHEWSVDGGHLEGTAPAPLRIRTFFEDALKL
jgi:hypothetical protein